VDNSGYHAIRNERTKLDLLAGLDVSREFFEGNDNDRTSLEAQLGQTLDHRLTPRLSLTEQLFFLSEPLQRRRSPHQLRRRPCG